MRLTLPALSEAIARLSIRLRLAPPPTDADVSAASTRDALRTLSRRSMAHDRVSGAAQLLRAGRALTPELVAEIVAGAPAAASALCGNPARTPALVNAALAAAGACAAGIPDLDGFVLLLQQEGVTWTPALRAVVLSAARHDGGVAAELLRRPDTSLETLQDLANAPIMQCCPAALRAAVLTHPHADETLALALCQHRSWEEMAALLVVNPAFALDPAVGAYCLRVVAATKASALVTFVLTRCAPEVAAQCWTDLARRDITAAASALGGMPSATIAVLDLSGHDLLQLLTSPDARARTGAMAALRAVSGGSDRPEHEAQRGAPQVHDTGYSVVLDAAYAAHSPAIAEGLARTHPGVIHAQQMESDERRRKKEDEEKKRKKKRARRRRNA
jgi:hypothetical protein